MKLQELGEGLSTLPVEYVWQSIVFTFRNLTSVLIDQILLPL